MRIAFLSSSTGWGGLERNLLRYAQWMKEIGHQVELNCVQGSPIEVTASTTMLPVRCIPRQRRHFPLAAAKTLNQHLQQSLTDFLWIRDPRDLSLCSLAVSGTSVDLLFHQGMQIPRPKTKPWHHFRFRRISRWIAPLNHLRDEALANTPLKPTQIEVIPLALDSNWFTAPRTAEAKTHWGIPPHAQTVGLFGRIDPLKGHSTLIRALTESGDAWHALIIGENTPNANRDYRFELQELAQTLDVAHRVHWHSPTEALLSAYDACDAYAMCSTSETIGMVTIEALARKVPVLGTNAGGTPELLGFGTQGTLFDPGDWNALALALQRIESRPVADDAHVEQFSKSGALKKWSETLATIRPSAS
ncbi:MAG: hypothetical protein CMD33_08415 [Flavobacteriales bacterium]|nr:hypothetical protein [Flavobacteriales bacterium]